MEFIQSRRNSNKKKIYIYIYIFIHIWYDASYFILCVCIHICICYTVHFRTNNIFYLIKHVNLDLSMNEYAYISEQKFYLQFATAQTANRTDEGGGFIVLSRSVSGSASPVIIFSDLLSATDRFENIPSQMWISNISVFLLTDGTPWNTRMRDIINNNHNNDDDNNLFEKYVRVRVLYIIFSSIYLCIGHVYMYICR